MRELTKTFFLFKPRNKQKKKLTNMSYISCFHKLSQQPHIAGRYGQTNQSIEVVTQS